MDKEALYSLEHSIDYIFIVKENKPEIIFSRGTYTERGVYNFRNSLNISQYINIDNPDDDTKILLTYTILGDSPATIVDYKPSYSIGVFYKKDLVDMIYNSWKFPTIVKKTNIMLVKNVDNSDYIFVSTTLNDMNKIIKKVNKAIKKLHK